MNFHSLARAAPGDTQGAQSVPSAQSGWGSGPAWALLASCALHLVLFWPSLPPAPPRLSLQNLVATLRAAPRAQERLVATPVLRTPSALATRPATVAAPPVAPTVLASAPLAAETEKTTAVSPRVSEMRLDGVDGDAMRGFRIALGRSALKHMRYPSQAQQQGWTGRAELRVVMHGDAAPSAVVALADIALARSSGHDELDREAIETLRRAVAVTPLPAALLGRDFTVDLPVIFSLTED